VPDDSPGSRGELSSLGINLAALVWGFAEATLFFIVPDVLLSWIALRQGRAALIACLWALVGALVGGTVMYTWGAVDLNSAQAALEAVPAISRSMYNAVGEQIHSHGVGTLFLGPLTGTPYKIYAVQAGAGEISLGLFLLVSGPARLVRFALITGLTIWICRWFSGMTIFLRQMIHLIVWTTFYIWYFAAFW
jgi:membrane protein YqaA with SNARE-associated domain